MIVLGTTYCIGSIGPYIQSYYRVKASDIQMIFPTVILLQTALMPVGSSLIKRIPVKILMGFGALFCIMCLLVCSFIPRDNFKAFFVVYTLGYAIMLAGTYMVPI